MADGFGSCLLRGSCPCSPWPSSGLAPKSPFTCLVRSAGQVPSRTCGEARHWPSIGAVPPFIYADIGGVDRWTWFVRSLAAIFNSCFPFWPSTQVLANLLSLAAICPFVGSLSDLLGRRYVALMGGFFLVLGSVIASTANTMNIFICRLFRRRKVLFRAHDSWQVAWPFRGLVRASTNSPPWPSPPNWLPPGNEASTWRFWSPPFCPSPHQIYGVNWSRFMRDGGTLGLSAAPGLPLDLPSRLSSISPRRGSIRKVWRKRRSSVRLIISAVSSALSAWFCSSQVSDACHDSRETSWKRTSRIDMGRKSGMCINLGRDEGKGWYR